MKRRRGKIVRMHVRAIQPSVKATGSYLDARNKLGAGKGFEPLTFRV